MATNPFAPKPLPQSSSKNKKPEPVASSTDGGTINSDGSKTPPPPPPKNPFNPNPNPQSTAPTTRTGRSGGGRSSSRNNESNTQPVSSQESSNAFVAQPLPQSRPTPKPLSEMPVASSASGGTISALQAAAINRSSRPVQEFNSRAVNERRGGFEIAVEQFKQDESQFRLTSEAQRSRAERGQRNILETANFLTGGGSTLPEERGTFARGVNTVIATGLSLNPFSLADFGVDVIETGVLSGRKSILTGQGLVASEQDTLSEIRRSRTETKDFLTSPEGIGTIIGGTVLAGLGGKQSRGKATTRSKPTKPVELKPTLEPEVQTIRTNTVTIPQESGATLSVTDSILTVGKTKVKGQTRTTVRPDVDGTALVDQTTTLTQNNKPVAVGKLKATLIPGEAGTLADINTVSRIQSNRFFSKQFQGSGFATTSNIFEGSRATSGVLGNTLVSRFKPGINAKTQIDLLQFARKTPKIKADTYLTGIETDIAVGVPVRVGRTVVKEFEVPIQNQPSVLIREGFTLSVEKPATLSIGSFKTVKGESVGFDLADLGFDLGAVRKASPQVDTFTPRTKSSSSTPRSQSTQAPTQELTVTQPRQFSQNPQQAVSGLDFSTFGRQARQNFAALDQTSLAKQFGIERARPGVRERFSDLTKEFGRRSKTTFDDITRSAELRRVRRLTDSGQRTRVSQTQSQLSDPFIDTSIKPIFVPDTTRPDDGTIPDTFAFTFSDSDQSSVTNITNIFNNPNIPYIPFAEPAFNFPKFPAPEFGGGSGSGSRSGRSGGPRKRATQSLFQQSFNINSDAVIRQSEGVSEQSGIFLRGF